MAADAPDATDRERRLDEVLASYLEAVESGQAPDRRQWLARYPDLATELEAFFRDEDQFDSLVAPLRTDSSASSGRLTRPMPVRPEASTPLPENGPRLGAPEARRVGDYEILGEIARGGMGVVYRARQVSLNRTVALKMIRGGRLAAGDEVQRFRLEAEAAACLDHPHIVPIYEVGEHDGQPYFSMKLIEGGSLAQRAGIRDQGSATRKEGERWAASLLATVARAVHYAHRRGLLHRDLKPANILLDDQGRPHVTDFGLAKRLADFPNRPGDGEGRLTHSGIAVGTPNYMAPEQAAGPRQALTTAADVYSLGAILYELLTGRPPFQADTPLETLVHVLEKAPPRPRELAPEVDRDLETVCLKCLEKDPSRRYPSAEALADDLERWRRGEPIQGRPAGRVERLGRWCRRNPALAASGALAGLGLLAAAVVSFCFALSEARHVAQLQDDKKALEAEREKARRHAREADEQRALAEANFRHAHEAVGDFCFRLGEDSLRRYPGLQAARKAILETGLKYYERFLRQKADDPVLRREQADTLFRVALITNVIGSKEEALAAYRKALAARRDLLRARPADVGLRAGVADVCVNMAMIQNDLGQPREAVRSLETARDLYAGLCRDRPRELAYRSGLAKAYGNLGIARRALGRFPEALDAFRRSLALDEELVRRAPRSAAYRMDLAVGHANVGVIHGLFGRDREALACYQKARAIQEALSKERPGDEMLRRDLALNLQRIGGRLGHVGRADEGLPLLERGHALFERLARANPTVTHYQSLLADSHTNLGVAYENRGRLDQALRHGEKGREIREKLARRQPGVWPIQDDLAESYLHLGVLQGKRGRPDEAVRLLHRARALAEGVVAANPDSLDYRRHLAEALYQLARGLAGAGHPDGARAAVRQAVDQRRHVRDRNPALWQNVRDLARCGWLLADLEARRGRPGVRRQVLRGNQDLLERFAADRPRDFWLRCDLSDNLVDLATAYEAVRQFGPAAACLQRARAIRLGLIAEVPAEPHYRGALGLIYFRLALVHSRQDRWAETLRYYRKSRAVLERLVRDRPDLTVYRENLCAALNNLALACARVGRPAEGEEPLRRAIAHQQRLLDQSPGTVRYRKRLSGHYRNLADVLRRAGRLGPAAAAARKCRDLFPADPGELYEAACDLAATAGLVGGGKAKLTAEEAAQRQAYCAEALKILRQAVRHGFRERAKLERRPELALLRGRPEYQKLLAELPAR